MKAKAIEYAYPSSTTAVKHGHATTGCWVIKIYPSVESTIGGKDVEVFGKKETAIAFADAMTIPYTNMHLKYFNK